MVVIIILIALQILFWFILLLTAYLKSVRRQSPAFKRQEIQEDLPSYEPVIIQVGFLPDYEEIIELSPCPSYNTVNQADVQVH